MELDRLLGVHCMGPVEVAEVGWNGNVGENCPEGGQHLLLNPSGVLSGELQVCKRIAEPGTDANRIEQRIRRRPTALLPFSWHSD
jgi:hypothetical protein